MGQLVIGIMFGCPVPKNVDFHQSREDQPTLMERWHGFSKESAHRVSCPLEFSHTSDKYLVGYWVTITGRGDDLDVPTLGDKSIRLSQLAKLRSYKRAERRWAKFRAWMLEQKIRLPEGELWITTTEIA